MLESFDLALPFQFSTRHGFLRDLLGKVLLELKKALVLAQFLVIAL
jgi:hypothetical protein